MAPFICAGIFALGGRPVAWRLDRLGRSLAPLIEVVAGLEALGVGFRSLAKASDTTTPGGVLFSISWGLLDNLSKTLSVNALGLGHRPLRGGMAEGNRWLLRTSCKKQKNRLIVRFLDFLIPPQ